MVTCLLGYHTDQWVDAIVLGFLLVFSTGQKPSILFNYSQYLADVIHEPFLKFKVEGVFKNQPVLVYLMLFYQADRFKVQLQKMGDQGSPLPVIHWTSLVRINSEDYSFSNFVDQFLHTSLCLLSSDAIPRISPEINKVLHLSEQSKVGDCYL